MPEIHRTHTALILAAWLLVGIPAGWGIYNTAINAKKLFTAGPANTPQK